MLLIPYIANYDDIMFQTLAFKAVYDSSNGDSSTPPTEKNLNHYQAASNPNPNDGISWKQQHKHLFETYADVRKNTVYPQFLDKDLGKGGGMFGFLSSLVFTNENGKIDWTTPFFTPFDFKEKVVPSSGAGHEQEKTYYKYIDQNKIIHKIYA